MLSRVMPVSIVSEGVELLVPIALGIVIDVGIVGGSLTYTLLGALLIVLMRIGGMYAWIYVFLASQRARMETRHQVRVALTAAVLDPRSRQVQRPAGEVLSIATSDADKASDLLDMLPWVTPTVLLMLAAGAWLTMLDPWLGLAMLIGIAVQILVIRGITPVLSRRYDAQQSRAADAAATATDLVHGLRVLQGLGVQSRARIRYRQRSRVALDAALHNARFSGVSNGLTTAVSAVMLAAVVLIAAQRALAGELSVGTLIAVAGVARYIMGILEGLSGVPVWWASISTSGRRVRDLLSDFGRTIDDPELVIPRRDPDEEDSQVGAPRRDGVGGLHVTGARHRTLRGLDLTVADGEIVAVACADVRDADSLVELVAGRTGEVPAGAAARIGERPITASSRFDLRGDLLVEPHVVDLFDGTLRDQLATRVPADVPRHDDTWARGALHAAGAEDLLGILPEGYDTRILDRGANLSGGQRQRIALARAVAADAPVLVLHDPTTAVDAVTEQHIAEALVAARRVPDRATVLVTRAPALLREADRVVFVRGGRVEGNGAHAELMGSPDRADYRELVQR